MDKTEELIKSINKLTQKIESTQDRLMTIKEVSEEFNIGERKVMKIFGHPDLPVQDYTTPKKVLRSELLKFFQVPHPELNR
jgi:hypothetical protein